MKITKIVVHNYRGIATLDTAIADGGALIRGRNGAGKTSVLGALRACLEARDISPDAIRNGADRAEILVDLDHETVRRIITPKSSTVSIDTADGMTRKKPQSWLDDLIGPTLDPLDLYHETDPKKRRAKILAAMPIRVTREQLRQWVPDLPDGPPTENEHGLEVLERVRDHYYGKRKDANAAAKTARAESDRLATTVPLAPAPALDIGTAVAALNAAKAANASLESRAATYEAHLKRTTGIRARIEGLRTKAAETRPDPSMLASAEHAYDALETERRELTEKLRDTTKRTETADMLARKLRRENEEADALTRSADELEATLTASAPEPITQAEFDAAVIALGKADVDHENAHARIAWQRADEASVSATRAADEAQSAADKLDAVVDALTNDAPKALLASAGGIPGLALDGDRITLDGVSLDGLCGAEQLRFAVQVAKRANAGRKLKLLAVDGIERLDPEQLEVFMRESTRDGFQLVATRVDRGDVVVEAIEPAGSVAGDG